MIEIFRTAEPGILKKMGAKWTTAIKTAKTKSDRDKAIEKYKHRQIKDALSLMFYDKCAYCESYISNVSYGDIEHYKPKGKFPHLAVNWDNLLLSCSKCNGAGQKGEQWPTKPQGGPLVNPVIENPKDFFDFVFDEATKITLVLPKNKRGTKSEEVYGLNKHTLVKDRNIFVRKLVALAKLYYDNPEAKDLLNESILSEGEYAAFARMIKTKYVKPKRKNR